MPYISAPGFKHHKQQTELIPVKEYLMILKEKLEKEHSEIKFGGVDTSQLMYLNGKVHTYRSIIRYLSDSIEMIEKGELRFHMENPTN